MLGMKSKKEIDSNSDDSELENSTIFKKNKVDLKSLIAPAGIDAGYTNHLEIISSKTRYARSMVVSALPRMCTFPEFLRRMYTEEI